MLDEYVTKIWAPAAKTLPEAARSGEADYESLVLITDNFDRLTDDRWAQSFTGQDPRPPDVPWMTPVLAHRGRGERARHPSRGLWAPERIVGAGPRSR